MNVEITGRHIEITPALREFATEKLQKLTRLLDGPLDVHVVLGIEKHRHMAEIQVKSRAGVFSSAHETDDLYTSISDVAEKLERQAQKHKEKLQHHKHRKGPRDPEVAAELARADGSNADDASAADNPGPARIRRSQSYRLKPMSAEDAALEIESSTEDVLVYRDAQSDRICVVYRHRDGDLRLIEPEF